ncbi:hypothetical protein [Actinoplanes sp. GCM10030250]|uniref:hypothetical protein n=1 Tax=Actinoplanes sp. GCM10030250 TaxID=3273376 RepID=UPI00360E838C
MAALQAALSSTWILARELSPAKRRLARLGTVTAVAVVGWVVAPSEASDESEGAGVELVVGARPMLVAEGGPVVDPEAQPEKTFDKRKAAVTAAALGLSVAAVIGRRQLEKRWLARLTRNGHPRPTRGLAVRMAAVEFTGQLALQLADMHKPGAPKR